MEQIILCVGLPASGKSTWAKEQLNKNPEKYKRVNKDLFREALDNGKFSTSNEKFILDIRDYIVEKSLRKGYSVIVDDTNFPLGGKHYKRMCEIAKKVGDVSVTEKYFDISLKEAIDRNNNRSNQVPSDVIYSMYNRHVNNKHGIPHTDYFPPNNLNHRIKSNVYLPNCIIVDIDGTVAQMNGRSAYDWSNVDNDLPKEGVLEIIKSLYDSGKYKIIFLSGRDSVCREKTSYWLNFYFSENKKRQYDLFMRVQNDSRKDSIIKLELYKEHIENKYNVIGVFDDRNSVVELWRSLGLTCFQCDYGDF